MANVDIRKYILPTFQPLLTDTHLYKLMFGGRGGGKSTFVGSVFPLKLMSDARNNGVVFRQNEKDHKESTYNEIHNAIFRFSDLLYSAIEEELKSLGEYEAKAIKTAEEEQQKFINQWKFGQSPLKITFVPFGNKIIFRGFNDPVSIKSIKADKGFYNI